MISGSRQETDENRKKTFCLFSDGLLFVWVWLAVCLGVACCLFGCGLLFVWVWLAVCLGVACCLF